MRLSSLPALYHDDRTNRQHLRKYEKKAFSPLQNTPRFGQYGPSNSQLAGIAGLLIAIGAVLGAGGKSVYDHFSKPSTQQTVPLQPQKESVYTPTPLLHMNQYLSPETHDFSKTVIQGDAVFMNVQNISPDYNLSLRDPETLGQLSAIPLRDTLLRFTHMKNAGGHYVTFMNARLANVDYSDSHLPEANFANAHLKNAKFINTNLSGATLTNAILLEGTDFTGANLANVWFDRADLRQVQNLDKAASLQGAMYNATTQFPPGFDPKAHGMLKL